MYRFIQKTIDWGVKVASLAITGPATWVVATQLFSDISNPILLFVMRASAVFLIEGVLLSNWLLLEFDKDATPEIKARYGITALAMYISLLVIGWRHEGPTGLVFRLALLAALVGSGWDTYVYTWQRATSKIDRSAENASRVKRHARKLSIKEAIFRREAEHTAQVALIEAQSMASLEQTSLYGQRMIAGVHLEDKVERKKLLEAEEAMELPANGKKKRLPAPSQIILPPDLITLDYTGDPNSPDHQMKRSILAAFAEDPSYTEENLASKFGTSSEVVAVSIGDLVEGGLLHRDKRGRYVPANTLVPLGEGGRTKVRKRNGSKTR
ncbi:MAG: hypothetical protein JXB07_03685 [Anaerolineae bacterium]|nr:hypothetical protein [Anaerolineae bacterium]